MRRLEKTDAGIKDNAGIEHQKQRSWEDKKMRRWESERREEKKMRSTATQIIKDKEV
jgi:hypothetical protein